MMMGDAIVTDAAANMARGAAKATKGSLKAVRSHALASYTRPACELLFCLVLSGCSNWGTVTGMVTLDEKPLAKGLLVFNPKDSGAPGYGEITNGRYRVHTGVDEGVKPGEYIVTVSATTIPDEDKGERAINLAPEKYANPTTSGLTFKVEPGSNSFNIKLKSD